jgi:hypothetical protein
VVFGKFWTGSLINILETHTVCSFINVRFHNKDDQPLEAIKLLTMYVMETSRVVVHQPVEAACIVFNMEGFTLKNMVSFVWGWN